MTRGLYPGGDCGRGPCWKGRADSWKYRDQGRSKLILRNAARRQSIDLTLTLIGEDVLPPSAGEVFDQDPAVTVQLHNSSTSECWSSAFVPANTLLNSGGLFKAKIR